jgi:hypothetical protein
MDEVFETYVKLWRRAQADGLFVHYHGLMGGGLAGYFDHRENYGRKMKPEIAISRPYYKAPGHEPSRDSNAPPGEPQPDLVGELFTLAHEYGHSRSWAGRTEPAEYKLYDEVAKWRGAILDEESQKLSTSLSVHDQSEALRRALYDRLDEDARERIMREESLAWNIGREVLADLGYADIASYDATATKHLHNHRYRLGIDELGPVMTSRR